MFEAFDPPVNSVSCPKRDVTTVAPQALWSLNNATSFRQARAFAARLAREAGADPAARVGRAWRLALGRPPSAAEKAQSLRLLKDIGGPPDAALAKFCLVLVNLNEFAYVD